MGQIAAAAAAGHVKLTPLEQQVLALKLRHPDALLVVEVGAKLGVGSFRSCRESGVADF